MAVSRKPLAKIEGRKRMQTSGLTVSWHGTRSLKDWVAYVEDGDERGRLVLADHVSERAVKGLLARIQSLSREDLYAMARPVEAVAQQGGGPPVRRTPGIGDATSDAEIAVPSTSRQLSLSGANGTEITPAPRPRRRRMAAAVEAVPAEARRATRTPSPRDLAGAVRQLRSRLESLEEEQEQLRAELAVLRGEAEVYESPPSIFVSGWFRATLVLIVLAIVVVVTVPWLMDFLEGGSRDTRPPVRMDAPVATPAPPDPRGR